MQTVALTLFRFAGLPARLWAFSQMGLSRPRLARLPDLEFFKMFGTGTGEGFTPIPNFSVYGLMTVWPDLDTARHRIAEARVFDRYRAVSSETCSLFLSAVSSRGAWDGKAPFGTETSLPRAPLAVLTRATLRMPALRSFWSHVPGIEGTIRQEIEGPLLFKIGMGEVPWLQQVTFSIWRSETEMVKFAYHSQHHREAIRQVRDGDWFREELYARFAVTGAEGDWEGKALAERLKPTPTPQEAISSFA
ncbi:MAG: spheroidene monooxygenase [Pseudomonadota bacterium]